LKKGNKMIDEPTPQEKYEFYNWIINVIENNDPPIPESNNDYHEKTLEQIVSDQTDLIMSLADDPTYCELYNIER